MRIAVVCNTNHPDHIKYFELILFAAKLSFKKTLAFKNKDFKINLEGIQIYNSSISKNSFWDIRVFYDFFNSFRILRIINKEKINTIHFTTAHISNIILAIFLKLYSKYLIFTIHDVEPHPGFKYLFIKIYNNLVFNVLANKVIVHNKDYYNRNKKQMYYVPLGGFEQKITTPKSGEYFLFFGRIDKYKGIENLLKIIENVPMQKFVIAGKGKINNKSRFDNLSNVTIINRFVDEEEVVELFNNAKMCILPYDSASQSGVILVSYSFATPVIAFNVGALKEYVINDKTGYIINYKDIKQFINVIKKISDRKLINLSSNVINHFKNNYTEDVIINRYREIYKSIQND